MRYCFLPKCYLWWDRQAQLVYSTAQLQHGLLRNEMRDDDHNFSRSTFQTIRERDIAPNRARGHRCEAETDAVRCVCADVYTRALCPVDQPRHAANQAGKQDPHDIIYFCASTGCMSPCS